MNLLVRVAAAALSLAAVASAQTTAAPDPAVLTAEAWIGRALILRGAYAPNDLDFDAAGHPKGSPRVTDWTLAGVDLLSAKRLPTGQLLLEGTRVAIGYNQPAHVFERHPLKQDHLRITLPAESVEAELAAIFSQGIDPAFERSLPPYWSHYFLPQLDWPADPITAQPILGLRDKIPAGLMMPVPDKKPEPDPTPEARAARIKGIIQLSVTVDPEGIPRRIVLRQPLGWGLDARVAEALARYRFKPGTVAGKPIAVEVLFNQTFDSAAPQ